MGSSRRKGRSVVAEGMETEAKSEGLKPENRGF
jgi:hypothetical protein